MLAAYAAADLFVFGSQVECSPLVLFEAVASGTPFVSTAAGNAEEIAEWTGGGVVVPSVSEGRPGEREPGGLRRRGRRGCGTTRTSARGSPRAAARAGWSEFTWDRIAERYEVVYERAAAESG